MKFLIVIALALASAQAATTTVNVGLSVVGNADGSVAITIGTGPAVTIPAATVTAAKGVVGLVNSIVSGISSTTNINSNLAVTVDSTTGAITATFNGQTITLDQNTINTVIGMIKNVQRAVAAGFPRPGRTGTRVGGKSRKHSNERRH